jgi:hypothetical protein
MRDWLIGIGLVFSILYGINALVGWTLAEIVLTAVMTIFLIKMIFSSKNRWYQLLLALCASMCLVSLAMPLALGFSRHQTFLFLLIISAILLVFFGYGPSKKLGRLLWTRELILSTLLLAIVSGYGLLTWNDYQWWPIQEKASHWLSAPDNEQLSPRKPVLILTSNLHPRGWLERVMGFGHFPVVSDLQSKARLKTAVQLASSPQETGSVIMLAYDFYEVGKYVQNGQSVKNANSTAYRSQCRVFLLDLAKGQKMELGNVYGSSPPSTSGGGDEYGDLPDENDIVQCIIRGLCKGKSEHRVPIEGVDG